MKKLNKKGFQIVELVIAVIAILAAVLIPTFSGVVDKANESADRQAARNALVEYKALDLADGLLDGKVNGGDAVSVAGVQDEVIVTDDDYSTWNFTGGKYDFSYSNGTWTATKK